MFQSRLMKLGNEQLLVVDLSLKRSKDGSPILVISTTDPLYAASPLEQPAFDFIDSLRNALAEMKVEQSNFARITSSNKVHEIHISLKPRLT